MKDKRTYTDLKEHGIDISYENEVKLEFDDRGSHDLTKQIDMLKKQKEYYHTTRYLILYNLQCLLMLFFLT